MLDVELFTSAPPPRRIASLNELRWNNAYYRLAQGL